MRYTVECALYGWEVVDLDGREGPRRCQTLDEAYTLVTCKPSESDVVIIDKAAARLETAGVQARLMATPQCRPNLAA